MKIRTWAAIAVLALGFSSCEYSRVSVGGAPNTQYHQTLQSLTKYERLFGLDKTLYETYITYYNAELAQLYVNEYARVYSISDAKKQQMLDEEISDASKYDEFMVGHYASDNDNQRLNTLDPKKVVWKFFLQTGDDASSKAEAIEIKPITLGTQVSYFYPYLNAWSKLYRVRFPKSSSAEKKLVMTGPIRELTFVWK